MPYDLMGAEDILAGLDVLGDGLSEREWSGDDGSGDDWGTMLSGAGDLGDLLAGDELGTMLSGAAALAPPAPAVRQYLARQHAAKQAALKAGTRDLAMRHAQAIVPRDYTRGRKMVIGIGNDASLPVTDPSGAVPGFASRSFSVQPQIPFKPDRFFVPRLGPVGSLFLITDIKVGQQSMFAASSAVPSSMFAENSVDSPVNFDTAQISQQLIVGVVNTVGTPQRFLGAFRGFSAL